MKLDIRALRLDDLVCMGVMVGERVPVEEGVKENRRRYGNLTPHGHLTKSGSKGIQTLR